MKYSLQFPKQNGSNADGVFSLTDGSTTKSKNLAEVDGYTALLMRELVFLWDCVDSCRKEGKDNYSFLQQHFVRLSNWIELSKLYHDKVEAENEDVEGVGL